MAANKYTFQVRVLHGHTVGMGSGVAIEHQGSTYIVTCNHVVRGAGQFSVCVNEVWHAATLAGVDEVNDIAILSGVSAVGAKLGDSTHGELRFFGHAGGRGQLPRRGFKCGQISSPFGFIVSAAAISGDSGCGVFNPEGECCGIVYATDNVRAYCSCAANVRNLLRRLFPFRGPAPKENPPVPPEAPKSPKDGIDPALGAALKAASERLALAERSLADMQKKLESQEADMARRVQELQSAIDKLNARKIHLDVVDENGATSSTSGTLGGQRMQLRFKKAP